MAHPPQHHSCGAAAAALHTLPAACLGVRVRQHVARGASQVVMRRPAQAQALDACLVHAQRS